jgi:hypothetical protein
MGTLDIIYKINEINLTNMSVYDVIMSGQKEMDLSIVKFVQILAKNAGNKIANLRFLVKNFTFYSEIGRLHTFLEAFSLFYALILHTMLLKENKQYEDSTNSYEKVEKSISEIYFENYLISNRIEELEGELNALIARNNDRLFVSFVSEFYEKFVRKRDLLKWLINEGTQVVRTDEG